MKKGWTYTSNELVEILGAAYSGESFECSNVSTDTRTLEEGDLFFALSGEKFDGNEFVERAMEEGAVACVTTRAIEGCPCLIVEEPLVALQALARHHRRRFDIPILAITGSCGKTSCKDMIAAVLATKYAVVKTKGNLNNNIGCPLSIMQLDDSTEFMVVEMGANHVGEIAELCAIAAPTESVITMVAPAHLEGFGTIEDVARAKGEIAKGLPSEGTFYINTDDHRCLAIGQAFPGTKVMYGEQGDYRIRSVEFVDSGEMVIDIDPVGKLTLPLYARAHAQNVLLAVTVGFRHGITEFEPALRVACLATTRFKVSTFDGMEIIDDTYNANPESMRAAIEALASRPGKGQRIAVLGCMGELGPESEELHRQTGTLLGKNGITTLLVRGPFADAMVAGARSSGVKTTEIIDAHDAMAERVRGLAQPGDVILFKGSRGMTMERVIVHLVGQ